MGWNSWNHFGCHELNEVVIRETADALVESGLRDLGYVYVNLDDCWQSLHRDPDTGAIQADIDKFPSGLAALSEYIHERGLRFGLYSDAGYYTCQKRPGSWGYEQQDAAFYASLQVDYLKYDNCYAPPTRQWFRIRERYEIMRDALNITGRPIFYHMCEWGWHHPATWAQPIANAWRTTRDIANDWNSVLYNLQHNDQWHGYAGPGGWNDPDMLEVGNGVLSLAESRAQFTLWALIKAPLILGHDVRNMSAEILEILSNEEIIAIHQDPAGIQGYKVASSSSPAMNTSDADVDGVDGSLLEVWMGPLSPAGHLAVVLFNRSPHVANMTVHWDSLDLPITAQMHVRDLWQHVDVGCFVSQFTAMDVPPHDVVALRIRPAEQETTTIEDNNDQDYHDRFETAQS